ncbi:DUF559 domain-containing protein [Hoyosella altamirensis]|uniref:DUF559 domain-containing protein n=1 Tax=Hoyosella altamirensis TaxID=616997 RepID=A0A839RIS0_9ACTN|nr:DUF559 domain-containing protein [Hoyosella altamirensis]MBB3036565.1 hypothetical protein [Hoyosella altamirensis]
MHPFTPAQRGLARGQLRGYQRVLRGVYIERGTELTPLVKARAAWVWADGECVLSGVSAAAVHNVRYLPDQSAEIVTRKAAQVRGLVIHRDRLEEHEVMRKHGMRLTTPARTAFDIARRHELDNAVTLIDALYQATPLTPDMLAEYAELKRGSRGITALREVLLLADPGAESPRETRLRLLIVRAGLPRPVTQHTVRDGAGRFIARADLAWPRWKVAVEYDGAHHFEDPRQARRDAMRANAYMRAGWRVIRVVNEHLRTPELLIRHIEETLRDASRVDAA